MGMNEIDYEHFDFDKLLDEVKQEIEKPNILICGGTGVGKSSLICDIFDFEEGQGPDIGNSARPQTRGINEYISEDSTVNLFDSEGYEIGGGDSDHKFESDIISFILDRRKSSDMENYIHEAWYCVSAAGERFFDWDRDMIRKIRDLKIPIMVIITQVDRTDEDSLESIKNEIKNSVPGVSIFTYSTELSEDLGDVYTEYVQRDEILKWAMENLDESLGNGLLSAVKGSIAEKRDHILKKVVPKYAGLAASAVLPTTFINDFVPADSIALTALQTKMALEIAKIYGMDKAVGTTIESLIGGGLVSFFGRKAASKLINVVASMNLYAKAAVKVTETAVNTTVATSITATLGSALTVLYEQYLKQCVDKNGKATVAIDEFFNSEQLKAAIEYVKDHKDEYAVGKGSKLEDKTNKKKK